MKKFRVSSWSFEFRVGVSSFQFRVRVTTSHMVESSFKQQSNWFRSKRSEMFIATSPTMMTSLPQERNVKANESMAISQRKSRTYGAPESEGRALSYKHFAPAGRSCMPNCCTSNSTSRDVNRFSPLASVPLPTWGRGLTRK